MKNRIHQIRSFASLAGAMLLLTISSMHAQTYTWADNAQGQVYLACADCDGGTNTCYYYYPSNSLWSQSADTNSGCNGLGTVMDEPSNWDPAPPLLIYPGGPGAVGVDVVLGPPANTLLDEPVILNSLTIESNGGLAIFSAGGVTVSNMDIQGDGGIGNGGGGGGGPYVNIVSGGTLTKSGGTGTFGFQGPPFGEFVELAAENFNLVVMSGTLALPTGADGRLNDGTIAVSNNTTLLLTVDSNAQPVVTGNITGVGEGTVLMNVGFVNCAGYDFLGNYHSGLTLNFPGNMFQWTGGQFTDSSLTNIGVFNLTNTPGLYGTYFYNNSTVNLADNSSLHNAGQINNDVGGTFNMGVDSSVTDSGFTFNNYGLLKISAGAGLAQISSTFDNYGGTVEVDSGTLTLNSGGVNYFSNATLIVEGGAELDLSITNEIFTNYNTELEGTVTGSGGGTVLVNSGTVYSYYQATLNFPGSMFQWQGGYLGGNNGFLTNIGTINISGPVTLEGQEIANNGAMIQSGIGGVSGAGGYINNNAGGVYQIQNDNGVSVNIFNNYGLLEKTGGSGTSAIGSSYFYNWGSIQPASGVLSFTGEEFYENAGTLQISPAITFGPSTQFYLSGGTVTGVGPLGGNGENTSVIATGGVLAPGNPFGTLTVPNGSGLNLGSGASFSVVLGGSNLFSQLVVSNGASLNGTLNVTLTNGYVLTTGTQIQIIACSTLGGSEFSTLNVPQGISVTYSNTGVYLSVPVPVSAQLLSPQISSGIFSFNFGTINGQSYTVQQSTNLATTNWNFCTNITGTGSLYQFTVPVTNNIRANFFRVREP
jgi:hypothetical protein